MLLLSIDTETSGLDHDSCQILEFGAVKRALDGGRTHFRRVIKTNQVVGEPYALAMNSAILYEITKEGVSPAAFLNAFTDWLGRERYVVIGKNVGSFDLQFLRKLVKSGGSAYSFPWGHRCVDIGNLFLRPSDTVPPDLTLCKERAGVVGAVTHNALDDANDVLDCFEVWASTLSESS